jgi:hypothetical protein
MTRVCGFGLVSASRKGGQLFLDRITIHDEYEGGKNGSGGKHRWMA